MRVQERVCVRTYKSAQTRKRNRLTKQAPKVGLGRLPTRTRYRVLGDESHPKLDTEQVSPWQSEVFSRKMSAQTWMSFTHTQSKFDINLPIRKD